MHPLLKTRPYGLDGVSIGKTRGMQAHRASSQVLICGLVLLAFLFSFAAFAAETPIPPAPSRWVTDTTGFLSPQTRQSLDARLEGFERSSGHQVIVYIGDTTGGIPIEDWAVRAFEAWRVGRKGIDDGLVLFIMARDRKLRIEVGYGLEPVLPDATASRIIREIIVPSIQSGNNDAAVTNGVNSIISVISGGSINGPPADAVQDRSAPGNPQRQSVSLLQIIFFGIIGVFFLILFITNPWLAMQLLFIILSGGRGSGGGGGGGGGFRGGGGRSGGGGASGSW